LINILLLISPHLMGIFDYSEIDEVILLTSRGCPFDCIFCYTPVASKHKIRFHSFKRVLEEIKWVVKREKIEFGLQILIFHLKRKESIKY